MKKILITGADSYIGTSFEKWVGKYPEKYLVDTIDLKDGTWIEKDFSGYDVVFHVAGIAHVSLDPNMEALYYKVNRDLTIQTAKKAKSEGVNQFIFMSSIIVYGDSSYKNKKRVITEDTIPEPTNFYGNSKLQAEEGIKYFEDETYKIVIIRPPMIYGKGSKGNYPKLSQYAKKFPIFPDIDNQRSMLHVDNLCEFIRLMIENEEQGLFFPQNAEYIKTSEMVSLIAEVHGRKIILTKIFNPIIELMFGNVRIIEKVFGDFIYVKSLSEYNVNYRINDLRESIENTEGS